jgi:hypothetical protein
MLIVLMSGFLLVTFYGCTRNEAQNNIHTLFPTMPPLPAWQNPFMSHDLTTVFLPADLSINLPMTAFTPMVDYMTDLAQEAGFALVFRGHDPPRNGFSGWDELYQRTIQQSHNAVFVYRYPTMLEHIAPVLGNFHDNVIEISPVHAERWAAYNGVIHEHNTIYAIPTDTIHNHRRLAVLIQNDVFRQYGQVVRTANDYEALLRWLKDLNPSAMPGIAAPMYAGWYQASSAPFMSHEAGIMAFNLFFPDMGLRPMPVLYHHITTFDRNQFWITPQGMIYEPNELLYEARDAFDRTLNWREDGLIHFVRSWGLARPAASSYPTILVNIEHMPFEIPMSQYTINMLYPEIPMGIDEHRYVAVAAAGTDMREFIRFLVWLDNIESYTWFMFGREGEDYEINPSTGMIYGVSDYTRWPGRLFFRNDRFNDQLMCRTRFPAGYAEELAILEPFAPMMDIEQAMQALNSHNVMWHNNQNIVHYYNNYWNWMRTAFIDVYFSSIAEGRYEASRYFQQIQMFQELHGSAARIMNNALAGIRR